MTSRPDKNSDVHSDDGFAYLTTKGRGSGLPRTVELWCLARVGLASLEIGTAMAAKCMGWTTGTTLPKWASEGYVVTVELLGDDRVRDAFRGTLDDADRQFGPVSAELIESAKSELLRNRARANPDRP